jgi:MFS transporter, DHA3 family, macrolide efflux protein
VWVDRLDRRKVLVWADLGAGLMTVMLLVLHRFDAMQLWHLYLVQFMAGTFEAFQLPAYSAATTLLLPKAHYGRAAGLRFVAEHGAMVISPFLAGILLIWIGLDGVMLIDVLTFFFAVFTLFRARIPELPIASRAHYSAPSFNHELRTGFTYLRQRPGLLGLTLIFTGMNFFAALTYYSTFPALILARSGGSELALATVQGVAGIAGVLGSLWVSIWGGPRRKIHGILLTAAFSFLAGDLLLAIGRTTPVWIVGAFMGMVVVPLIGGSNEAIWQAKVEPALQGRVFSAKNMLGQLLSPAGYLLGGVLADQLFEPAMMPGGALAASFGGLVGVGPGAGMALLFVMTSLCGAAMSLSGYLFPAICQVEDDLADHAYTAAAAD